MKCSALAVVCLASAGAAFADPIEQISIHGNHRIETDAIRLALTSRVGQDYDPARIRDDIHTIYKLGVFADVQVFTEATPTPGVIVTVELIERPSIHKVLVAGNHEVKLDKINDVLDLEKTGVADIAAIRKNRDKIAELYVAEGYLFASVDYELVAASPAEVDVKYTIDEHAKVTVGAIRFTGNRAIGSDELRDVMTTKPPGALSFLTGSGVYRREGLERDLAMLQAHYLDRGYATVKIGAPELQLSRDRKRMSATITIDEGPQFTLASIDVRGDLLGDPARHLAMIESRAGMTFSRTRVEQDRKALETYYQDHGYANANVAPRFKPDLANRRIALAYEIVRGKRVYIEHINIRGNSKTRDKVIRRELRISEGEQYSGSKLERSRAHVIALGYFQNVTMATAHGSSDEFVDVNIEVTERPASTFTIGAGFSSVESFIVQGQVAFENLAGRGETLQGQMLLSAQRRIFSVRLVEPYFLDTQWTFAAELYNTSRGLGSYARTATGGSMTWGYPLSDHAKAFLTYRLEDVGITTGSGGVTSFGARAVPLPSLDTANLFRGGWTSSVRASLAYDTRNNRLFPTEGIFATAYAEYAGRLTASENQFVRWGGFARRYHHIGGPFVLRLNGEFGVTESLDDRGVPLTERYLLGGISDIRGYQVRSLGPHLWTQRPGDPSQGLDPLTLGGNLQIIGNAELEFPLSRRLGLSGVVFFDIGNAYNLESRFCGRPGSDACVGATDMISGLRKSIGAGVRWMSPIGPLRFEWGIPLDLKAGEKPAGLEFTIGTSF